MTRRVKSPCGRRTLWPRRGQSLVEMALMMPLIALLLVGTVDLGRAFFYYVRLTNAVREGAIFGVSRPAYIQSTSIPDDASKDPNNIKFRVMQESGGLVTDLSDITVTCYDGLTQDLKSGAYPLGNCGNAQSGDAVEVRATYQFRPLTVQMTGILGGGFSMSKSVRMVIL